MAIELEPQTGSQTALMPDRSSEERPLSPSRAREIGPDKKPDWLRIRPPAGAEYRHIKKLLKEKGLHTVCEEAHCPNLSECWSGGTATFMLGGDICTRACRFCAIKTARVPPPMDPLEPAKIAASIAEMKLKYVVLTSVDRDDLEDGGASHFAATIAEIKRLDKNVVVEALMSDFRGREESVAAIVDSGVDVYAHNIETVRRLQYRVRDPRANYEQSLGVLNYAKNYAAKSSSRKTKLYTKSSIMLGLGEEAHELTQAYKDLRQIDVDVLTLGQYLRPSLDHLPVEKFVTPEEFKVLGDQALSEGFLYVASGPLVRSSYKAGEYFLENKVRQSRADKEKEMEKENQNGL